MARQLNLIPPSADDDWRLDDATIASGRRGLAKAREALARAQARLTDDRDHQTAA